MNTSYFQNPTEFAHELSEQLNGKLSPEEILEVISTDLDEGLFGNLFGNLFKWVGGLFKNPRLKRELDKLGEQLFQTKVKIGNLKVQSDAAIEDYEQSLKDLEDVKSKLTKDPYAVTRAGFGNDDDILKSAYEDNIKRQIEQLEELERDITRRMDAIGEDEEDDRIQKYADKIKMDVMLKSTEAIMRMADTETKRVLSKIQNIYQKNNQIINKDLEQAMKADESLQESYNDYPAAAKANAKKAIEWKEKYGRDVVQGGTEVGWARAHQLAKGESLSADVVSRMAQFNRHRQNSKVAAEFKDEPWRDNGHIAWLIWGGDEGVDWAIEKMKEIKKDSTNENKNQYNNMGLRMKKVVSIDEWLKVDKNITDSDSVNEAVTLDAINQLYGFWGTLEDSGVKKLEKNVKNLFFEAINGLVQKHGLSEDEAVKVLNSKMGRKAADQIIDGQADSGLLGLEQYYGKYLKVEIKKVLAMKESVDTVDEAYDGKMADFKYDLEMALEEIGISSKAIKRVSKVGKKFEVRMSSYMSQRSTWEKIGELMGAALVEFKPDPKSINVGLYESVEEAKMPEPRKDEYYFLVRNSDAKDVWKMSDYEFGNDIDRGRIEVLFQKNKYVIKDFELAKRFYQYLRDRGVKFFDQNFVSESVEVNEAANSEIEKKVQKFVIKNANDYEYSNQDSAFQIYLALKKLYPGLIKESAEVNEARSLNKIQKDFTAVTSEMSEVVMKWKEAKGSGDAKAEANLLARLKELTAKKKGLEREMDEFVMGKDRDAELAGALESFMNERYDATESLAELKAWLLKSGVKFVKSTEEFNGDEGGLWIAPTENDVMGGKRMFDFRKGTNATYSNGILKKIADKAEALGFWFEWYDAETLMVWPIN